MARPIADAAAFTRAGRELHLAVSAASHNRVLVVQLVSLQHVSWPSHNRTLTPKVAKHVLEVHRELTDLIEMRDVSETVDGKQETKKVPHVRPADDEKAHLEPLTTYAERELADYLPALRSESTSSASSTTDSGPRRAGPAYPIQSVRPNSEKMSDADFQRRLDAARATGDFQL